MLREHFGKRRGCKGAFREDQYHATGTVQNLWILGKQSFILGGCKPSEFRIDVST